MVLFKIYNFKCESIIKKYCILKTNLMEVCSDVSCIICAMMIFVTLSHRNVKNI